MSFRDYPPPVMFAGADSPLVPVWCFLSSFPSAWGQSRLGHPKYPQSPHCILGFRYISKRDFFVHIIHTRYHDISFAGGPPSNECGWTGGDNEVWNLAKDAAHYRAMAKVVNFKFHLLLKKHHNPPYQADQRWLTLSSHGKG